MQGLIRTRTALESRCKLSGTARTVEARKVETHCKMEVFFVRFLVTYLGDSVRYLGRCLMLQVRCGDPGSNSIQS